MKQFNAGIIRVGIALALFVALGAISCVPSRAEDLQSGSRYKIMGTLHISGIYRNLNHRQLNRQMAYGTLTAVRFSGPEVAFQREVPTGTVMTVISTAPKRLPLSFYANRYFVQLNPDPSRGLDVILELNRGIEGSLDGLNPELFERMK